MEESENQMAKTAVITAFAAAKYVGNICKYGGAGFAAGVFDESSRISGVGPQIAVAYTGVFVPGIVRGVGDFLNCYFTKEMFDYKARKAKTIEDRVSVIAKRAAIVANSGMGFNESMKYLKSHAGAIAIKGVFLSTAFNSAGYMVGRIATGVVGKLI
jgi:hypothetical protein